MKINIQEEGKEVKSTISLYLHPILESMNIKSILDDSKIIKSIANKSRRNETIILNKPLDKSENQFNLKDYLNESNSLSEILPEEKYVFNQDFQNSFIQFNKKHIEFFGNFENDDESRREIELFQHQIKQKISQNSTPSENFLNVSKLIVTHCFSRKY